MTSPGTRGRAGRQHVAHVGLGRARAGLVPRVPQRQVLRYGRHMAACVCLMFNLNLHTSPCLQVLAGWHKSGSIAFPIGNRPQKTELQWTKWGLI